MTKNTKTIIGVGAVILLLLYLRKRKNSDVNTLRGVSADELDDGTGGTGVASGGGGGGGAIGGGGGIGSTISGIFGGGGGSVTPPPVVINNPVINTLRPMPIAQSQVSPRPATSPVSPRPATSPVSPRPATSPVSLRPATSPNTTEAVSQAPLRSSFLTFDGTFRNASGLDFDGNIID
jgi:hypothetical protein